MPIDRAIFNGDGYDEVTTIPPATVPRREGGYAGYNTTSAASSNEVVILTPRVATAPEVDITQSSDAMSLAVLVPLTVGIVTAVTGAPLVANINDRIVVTVDLKRGPDAAEVIPPTVVTLQLTALIVTVEPTLSRCPIVKIPPGRTPAGRPEPSPVIPQSVHQSLESTPIVTLAIGRIPIMSDVAGE